MTLQQNNMSPAAVRYETGLRLRRFEQLWETASSEDRRAALSLVNQAVMGFLSGGLVIRDKSGFSTGGPVASAMALDTASILVRGPAHMMRPYHWWMPFAISPSARLLDSANAKVRLTLGCLYGQNDKLPEDTTLLVQGNAGLSLVAPVSVPLTNLPQTVPVSLADTEVDSRLTVSLKVRGRSDEVTLAPVHISLARNLVPRLRALEGSSEPTVRHLLPILKKLTGGEALETDYPGLRLLREAEAAAQGKPLWGKRQAGQFWLSLDGAPVRLLAPRAVASGKPLPLVLALHGAGGSENLFFDGYGDGKLVRLCEKKGWLVLTTRNGQGTAELPRLLGELEKLYPVDRKRVFLVGHSMGAAMGSQLVSRNPGVFSAAALLGGGGVVGEKEKLPRLFVAAGASDFGRSGAERLAQAAGVACKVYPNCEHLTVVQNALDDVIAFFEKG